MATKASSKKKTTAKAAAPKKAAKSKAAAHPNFDKFICNVIPSKGTDNDWQLVDSIAAGSIGAPAALPKSVDLRASWWAINNQENTGSCVGWATADGVVRYHMVKAGRITQKQLLSPRHVWMASKETDTITTRPESFIEGAGTTLKAAVDVARKHGVALMDDLPFHIQTKMFTGNENTFYAELRPAKGRGVLQPAPQSDELEDMAGRQRPDPGRVQRRLVVGQRGRERRQDRHVPPRHGARRPRHLHRRLSRRRPIHRPQQLGHGLGRQRIRLPPPRLHRRRVLRRVLRRHALGISGRRLDAAACGRWRSPTDPNGRSTLRSSARSARAT